MGVANIPIAPARVFKLGSRRDGVVVAFPECNLKVGEIFPIWLDPSAITGGQWLASADNQAVTDTDLVIDEIDVTRDAVAIMLDTTALSGGETITLTCNIHPTSGQTIKAGLVINMTA
jgi:hypothetical protein